MENLTAVPQNRSYAGHIKGNNVLFRTLVHFNWMIKYKGLLAFLIILAMWSFHFRLLLIVSPSILAFITTSSWPESIFKLGKLFTVFEKEITSSLYLATFSCSLSVVDQVWTLSTASWMLVVEHLGMTSEMVVSSMYFQVCTWGEQRSFIMSRKSHGPNFVPCGTPDRISASFTFCLLMRKLVTQRLTKRDMDKRETLSARIWWSMRSKALR